MQTVTTDSKNRKIVLSEEQLLKKWFRDNHAELSRIAHKASVVRNSPLFRNGFSKGLLALGSHLFVKMMIETFSEVSDPDPSETNKKTKFELFGKRFALALTSEEIGKATVTLKSNYKNDFLPEQEQFADYILLVQLMDFEESQHARFAILTYDVLKALPTKHTDVFNIELHTKHVNPQILFINTTFDLPTDVDQPRANKLIESAFDEFLNALAQIANKMIEE